MVRICWRRSRGLQVVCVASGPRPYWMLLDVPCSVSLSLSVCQHFDALAAYSLPALLSPAALPGLPPSLSVPTPLFKPIRRHWQEQGGGGGGGVVDPVSVASAICGRVACIGRRRRTALMPACLARNVS